MNYSHFTHTQFFFPKQNVGVGIHQGLEAKENQFRPGRIRQCTKCILQAMNSFLFFSNTRANIISMEKFLYFNKKTRDKIIGHRGGNRYLRTKIQDMLCTVKNSHYRTVLYPSHNQEKGGGGIHRHVDTHIHRISLFSLELNRRCLPSYVTQTQKYVHMRVYIYLKSEKKSKT